MALYCSGVDRSAVQGSVCQCVHAAMLLSDKWFYSDTWFYPLQQLLMVKSCSHCSMCVQARGRIEKLQSIDFCRCNEILFSLIKIVLR